MSTEDRRNNERKSQIYESASVVEAERAVSVESTEGIAMDVGEKFLEVLKLSLEVTKYKIECKKENALYARVQARMDTLFYDVIDSRDAKFDDIAVLARAYVHMSIPCINGKQNSGLNDATSHLTKCVELLNGEELHRKAILTVIRALIELAYINFLEQKIERSKLHLNHSMRLCSAYARTKDEYYEPVDVVSAIGIERQTDRSSLKSEYRYIAESLIAAHNVEPESDFKKMISSAIAGEGAGSVSCITLHVSSEFYQILKSSSRLLDIFRKTESVDGKNKYIQVLEAKMDKLFQRVINSNNVPFDDAVTLARAYLYLLFMSFYVIILKMDVLFNSENYLNKCMELLKGKELDNKTVFIAVKALNISAYISHTFNDLEKSKLLLDKASELYLTYTKEKSPSDSIDIAINLDIECNKNQLHKTLLETEYEMTLNRLRKYRKEALTSNLAELLSCSESTENIELKKAASADSRTMGVREKFLEVLTKSHKMIFNCETIKSQQKMKEFRVTSEKLDTLFQDTIKSKDAKFNEIVTLAQAYLYISEVCPYTNKRKIHNREFTLMRCIKLLDNKKSDPKAILTAMKALNQLIYIWLILKDKEKSESFLETTMRLYLTYTKEADYPRPIDIDTILGIESAKDPKLLLDTLFTETLNYLNVLTKSAAKSGQMIAYNAVTYMHETLKGKLKSMRPYKHSKGLVMQIISLSKYFLLYGRFTEARDHIAAASFVLSNFYTECYVKLDAEKCGIQREIHYYYYKAATVSVHKVWILYGNDLLRSSKKRLLERGKVASEEDSKVSEAISTKLTRATTMPEEKATRFLLFTDVKKDLEQFTCFITDKYLSSYNDAKQVFVSILKRLTELKAIYDINFHLKSHIETLLQVSIVYKNFALYEADRDKLIKLHRRRIKTLQDITKMLNPAITLILHQHIWMELANTYSTLLDIKTDFLQLKTNKLTVEDSKEINELMKSSLHSFRSFLNCF